MTGVLVHTGQHFNPNMSDIFFHELGISKPGYNLDIGGGHGAMAGLMMRRLEPLLQVLDLDFVLVYGGTSFVLAGVLAAAKLHISVAHVEAGLRFFNRAMLEEINRVGVDHLSERLFVSEVSCITLRSATEWLGLLDLSWSELAALESVAISEKILGAVGRRGCPSSLYGSGREAEAVAAGLAG